MKNVLLLMNSVLAISSATFASENPTLVCNYDAPGSSFMHYAVILQPNTKGLYDAKYLWELVGLPGAGEPSNRLTVGVATNLSCVFSNNDKTLVHCSKGSLVDNENSNSFFVTNKVSDTWIDDKGKEFTVNKLNIRVFSPVTRKLNNIFVVQEILRVPFNPSDCTVF